MGPVSHTVHPLYKYLKRLAYEYLCQRYIEIDIHNILFTGVCQKVSKTSQLALIRNHTSNQFYFNTFLGDSISGIQLYTIVIYSGENYSIFCDIK